MTPNQTHLDENRRLQTELADAKYKLATIELAARYNSAMDQRDYARARSISREHDALAAAHRRSK